MSSLEEMSKEELIAALRARQESPPVEGAPLDSATLIHDLEVHQIELEMQNRQLRETEAELQRSTQRYMELYDFAPIAYLTLDVEGRIQEANLTAATLLGTERGQLLGKPLISFVAVSHRAHLRGHVQRVFGQHGPLSVELDLSRSGKPSQPVSATSVSVLDDTGRVVGCRTTLTDISALKRTEARLVLLASASKMLATSLDVESSVLETLRAILPSCADVGMVDLVHGGEMRRFEARREAREPARVETARSVRPARSFRPDSPHSRVLESNKPILLSHCDSSSLAGDDGLDHEPMIQSSGARSLLYVPLSSRGMTLGVLTLISLDEKRVFSGADLMFANDLASRLATAVDNARLYREAREAVRGREDVLSFVAHDLRTFLFGSRLAVDILLRSVRSVERRRGWQELDRVQRLNAQMARMIEDLLDVSSLDSGRLSLKLSDWPATDLLSQAVEALAVTASAGGIAFTVDATDALGKVCCDAARVMQIFGNIVGNAVKFTPKGGSITISASSAGEHVQFAVHDTGPGIAPELLDHLFERYWQADEGAQKGRGLGLYIAKQLVEAQGGRIWVESHLGAGTTLFFTLPRANPFGARVASASDLAPPEHSPSVMIGSSIRTARVGRRPGALFALIGVMAAAWVSAGATPLLRAAEGAPAPNDFTPDYVAAYAWLHGGPRGPAAAAVLDGEAGNAYGLSIGAPPVLLLAAYYVHPPTAFLTLMPLVPLGYRGAALGWLLLSVASLGALTVLLLSAAGRRANARAAAALFMLLLLWPPMLTNIQRGQWSILSGGDHRRWVRRLGRGAPPARGGLDRLGRCAQAHPDPAAAVRGAARLPRHARPPRHAGDRRHVVAGGRPARGLARLLSALRRERRDLAGPPRQHAVARRTLGAVVRGRALRAAAHRGTHPGAALEARLSGDVGRHRAVAHAHARRRAARPGP